MARIRSTMLKQLALNGPLTAKANGGSRLTDVAYERIKELLLTRDDLPEVLSEQVLATHLGFSKTPVREALYRLSQEGLLRLIPRRGYLVPEVTQTDVRHLFELREAVEGMAARLAADRIRDDELHEIEEAVNRAGDLRDDVEDAETLAVLRHCNEIVHGGIMCAAGNPRLEQALAPIRDQIKRVLMVSLGMRGQIRGGRIEHVEILHALQRRDPDGADAAMRAHIRATYQHTVRRVR
ncbi:MAG: GntR family transcriptional regulator [Chloroflexi bacterium]|nr:GntR family transcriptional regulator [Chloroflexota bacterium]